MYISYFFLCTFISDNKDYIDSSPLCFVSAKEIYPYKYIPALQNSGLFVELHVQIYPRLLVSHVPEMYLQLNKKSKRTKFIQ